MTGTNRQLTAAVEKYFADLRQVRASGGATGERSSYTPLANLLNAVGATLKPKVFCVGELADQGAGHPDFGLYGAKQVQRGRPREGQTPEHGVVETPGAVVPRRFRPCPPFECSPCSFGEVPCFRFALRLDLRRRCRTEPLGDFPLHESFREPPGLYVVSPAGLAHGFCGTTTQLPADSCVAHRNRLTPCCMNRFVSSAMGLVRASSDIALPPSGSGTLLLPRLPTRIGIRVPACDDFA